MYINTCRAGHRQQWMGTHTSILPLPKKRFCIQRKITRVRTVNVVLQAHLFVSEQTVVGPHIFGRKVLVIKPRTGMISLSGTSRWKMPPMAGCAWGVGGFRWHGRRWTMMSHAGRCWGGVAMHFDVTQTLCQALGCMAMPPSLLPVCDIVLLCFPCCLGLLTSQAHPADDGIFHFLVWILHCNL